jgi:hypothetical protein
VAILEVLEAGVVDGSQRGALATGRMERRASTVGTGRDPRRCGRGIGEVGGVNLHR